MKSRIIEIFLLQLIIYGAFWVWDSFIGLFMSIAFSVIALFILVVSIIAELIEKSKVPRAYFIHMIGAILAPLLALLLFYFLNGGLPDLNTI